MTREVGIIWKLLLLFVGHSSANLVACANLLPYPDAAILLTAHAVVHGIRPEIMYHLLCIDKHQIPDIGTPGLFPSFPTTCFPHEILHLSESHALYHFMIRFRFRIVTINLSSRTPNLGITSTYLEQSAVAPWLLNQSPIHTLLSTLLWVA